MEAYHAAFPEALRPKRKQVKSACMACRHASRGCDDERPCRRCTTRGIECEAAPARRKRPVYPAADAAIDPSDVSVHLRGTGGAPDSSRSGGFGGGVAKAFRALVPKSRKYSDRPVEPHHLEPLRYSALDDGGDPEDARLRQKVATILANPHSALVPSHGAYLLPNATQHQYQHSSHQLSSRHSGSSLGSSSTVATIGQQITCSTSMPNLMPNSGALQSGLSPEIAAMSVKFAYAPPPPFGEQYPAQQPVPSAVHRGSWPHLMQGSAIPGTLPSLPVFFSPDPGFTAVGGLPSYNASTGRVSPRLAADAAVIALFDQQNSCPSVVASTDSVTSSFQGTLFGSASGCDIHDNAIMLPSPAKPWSPLGLKLLEDSRKAEDAAQA